MLAVGGKAGEAFSPSPWEWFFFAERFHYDPNWKAASAGTTNLDITTYGAWVWTNTIGMEDLTLGTSVPINWMIPAGQLPSPEKINACGSFVTEPSIIKRARIL